MTLTLGQIDLVVTRHGPLVEYLRERKYIDDRVPIVAHVTEDDVRHRHVLGVLPLHLACCAARVIEILLALTLEDRAAMTRGDLPLERIRTIAGEPRIYTVREEDAIDRARRQQRAADAAARANILTRELRLHAGAHREAISAAVATWLRDRGWAQISPWTNGSFDRVAAMDMTAEHLEAVGLTRRLVDALEGVTWLAAGPVAAPSAPAGVWVKWMPPAGDTILVGTFRPVEG